MARVRAADPSATVLPSTDGVPGVRTAGPKMLLQFTCTHDQCDAAAEQQRTTKMINKNSYERGARAGWHTRVGRGRPWARDARLGTPTK